MNLFCLLLIAFLSLVLSEEKERFHDLDKHGGNEDQMEIMKAMMKRSEIKRREERKSQRMYEYQHRKGRFNEDPEAAAHERKRVEAFEKKQLYLRRESRHKRKQELYEKSRMKAGVSNESAAHPSQVKTIEQEENEVHEILSAKKEAENAQDQLAMGREGETTQSKDEHEHQFTLEAPSIQESIYDSDSELRKYNSSLPAVVSQVVAPAQGAPPLDQVASPPKPTMPPLTRKQSADAMKKVKGWLW